MNKITENKFYYTTTTTTNDFSHPGNPKPPILATNIVESNLLIQGKLRNNLYIDTPIKPINEQSHEYVNPMFENYFNYVEKIKKVYPNVFYGSIENSREHIKSVMNDLNRTNYHITHCRPEDGIVSKNTVRRQAEKNTFLPKNWLIDTTYHVC